MPQKVQPERRILLTTSRNPSRRTRTLIKDLVHVVPRAARISRGTKNLYELAAAALASKTALLVVVSTRKGNPGSISFFWVTEQMQLALELSLKGVKLRYEIARRRMPKADKLLVLPRGHLSPRAQRLCEILSKMLEAPLIEGPQNAGEASTIMKIEEADNIIRLTFVHGKLAKEVGPSLAIRAVKFLERA